MMISKSFSLPSALALAAIAAGTCRAQMGRQVTTLESMASQADVVVRARVVEVLRDEPVEGRDRMAVLLKVSETLKGDRAETLTFVERTLASFRIYEGWRDAGREPLWFFARDPDGSLRTVALIRLGPEVPEEKDFVRFPPPVMTMNLTALSDPDAILKAARASVLAEPKGAKAGQHSLWVPHAVMGRSGTTGDINSLTVPVDRRLEALAKRLIKSSEDALKPESDAPAKDAEDRRRRDAWNQSSAGLLRAEGAKALRHFKSDENVAPLKALLDDPSWSLVSGPGGDQADPKDREYYVRKAALVTLKSWGVRVAAPVIRERALE